MDPAANAAAHELQELELRLGQEAVLAQRERDAGVVGDGTAVPQAKGHVVLSQGAVQVAQRVKAAHVGGEQHDMPLQHRDGDMPGVNVASHVLDHLGWDLGLRLALADALQQRLAHGGPQRYRLASMVLLGQQLDDGLSQRRLRGCPAGRQADRQVDGFACSMVGLWPSGLRAGTGYKLRLRTCCSFCRLLHTMGNRSTHKWCATAAPYCTSSIRQDTCGG